MMIRQSQYRICTFWWTERHTDLKVLLVGFIFEGLSLQLINRNLNISQQSAYVRAICINFKELMILER